MTSYALFRSSLLRRVEADANLLPQVEADANPVGLIAFPGVHFRFNRVIEPGGKKDDPPCYGAEKHLMPILTVILLPGVELERDHQMGRSGVSERNPPRPVRCLDVVDATPHAVGVDMAAVKAAGRVNDGPHIVDGQLVRRVILQALRDLPGNLGDLSPERPKCRRAMQIGAAMRASDLPRVRPNQPLNVLVLFRADCL